MADISEFVDALEAEPAVNGEAHEAAVKQAWNVFCDWVDQAGALSRLGLEGMERAIRTFRVPSLDDYLPAGEKTGPRGIQAVLEEARRQGEVEVLPTSFPGLPPRVGYARGRITMIGAFTGGGKTSTLLRETSWFGAREHPILFVTNELSDTEVSLKLDAALGGTAGALPVDLLDGTGPIVQVLDHMHEWSDRVSKNAARTPIIFCDYLQRFRVEGEKNRERQVAIAAESLQTFSRRHKVAVVCAAQLNRASQTETKPAIHHFRESGLIEQVADVALLVGIPAPNRFFVSVAKNRWGPGVGSEVELTVDWATLAFGEVGPEDQLVPLASAIRDYLIENGGKVTLRDILRRVKFPRTRRHPKADEVVRAASVTQYFKVDGTEVWIPDGPVSPMSPNVAQ